MEKQIIEMQYTWAMHVWSAVVLLMIIFVVIRKIRIYILGQREKRNKLLHRRLKILELELKERREELRLTLLEDRYDPLDSIRKDMIKFLEQDIEDIENEIHKLS